MDFWEDLARRLEATMTGAVPLFVRGGPVQEPLERMRRPRKRGRRSAARKRT